MRTHSPSSGLAGRIIRRTLLVLLVVLVLAGSALVMVLELIFSGPSPSARNVLTMSLLEASATKWVPALFIGEETVTAIQAQVTAGPAESVTDTSQVVIQKDPVASADEWAAFPDGIRIDTVAGDTYTAHVMLVRDPERVYLGISNPDGFTFSVPGKRINEVMAEEPEVLAAVNAGAFWDNGRASSKVGAVPEGLVYSRGDCVWTTGAPPNSSGFAGFNEDHVLIVHRDNLTKAQAQELNIRDGCCFGPALIINGEVNMEAYNTASGWNPRTAIGQRADGAVIFVCIDGRQAGSSGGKYADVIDILLEYGAVNGCNMDGGSSTLMMYRDTQGRYGTPGETVMVNSYSLLQVEPRRMPDYWLVGPLED